MTLEEKLSQMMTRTPTELTRFGIPGYQWGGEAGHCVIARSGDPVLVRIDPVIDFNFGRGAPIPAIPVDYFSVRWTGRFIAPASGTYFIGGDFDDAIRLYIDGKMIIDKTNNRNRSSEAVKIELESGKQYDLRIEYIEQWRWKNIKCELVRTAI